MRSNRSVFRLFVLSAVISLIPVLALGVALARSYRAEAESRGLAEARSEASLLAQTAVEPLLSGTPLHRNGIAPGFDKKQLDKSVYVARVRELVLRFRLRDLQGNVVYADTASGLTPAGPPEDEVLDAARGKTIVLLTHENSDSNDHGPAGAAAVEVYMPLTNAARLQVGVLEVYLPYAPIRSDVTRGLHDLLRDALIALSLLYLALLALAWWVTRGLRREVARNKFLAEHDALTGLPNRSRFVAEAAAALATGHSRSIALVNLDRFTAINSALGHKNGDTILVTLAQRLHDDVRDVSVVARLGGDEFGLLLDPGADELAILTATREAIARELEVNGVPITVEASIGYAVAPDDGDNVADLLRHADVALHAAKRHHTGVVRYTPALGEFDSDDLALVTELKRAIAGGELFLNFQPKVELATGEFVSTEALVRWQHPTRGLLSPDRFLPLAEQTDLIEDLTDWVLNQALRQLKRASGPARVGVAVNVSPRTLGRDDFPDRVLQALGEGGVDPSLLTIEITETTLMTDPERAAIALSQLDAFGVKVSLDDFGTGQTSIGYLSSLPIDELKIDRSFTARMAEDPRCAAIVRSIIDLGHNLGLSVVAEGIETVETLQLLRAARCDVAQGYLFARPMPADALAAFLAAPPSVPGFEPSRSAH